MPLDFRQPRVEPSAYNLRPLPHRLRRSFSLEPSLDDCAVNSCLSSLYFTSTPQTPSYPLSGSNHNNTFTSPRYFPIHTSSNITTPNSHFSLTSHQSPPPTPSAKHNSTSHTTHSSSTTSISSFFLPWFSLILQFLHTSFSLIKDTTTFLLSDIYSFDFSSFFRTIFLPSVFQINQQAISIIPLLFQDHITQPLIQTLPVLYHRIRTYYMQAIFVSVFHLFQYILFTIWAYSHTDQQFHNHCINLRTALTIFIIFYYLPIDFRINTQRLLHSISCILTSYFSSLKDQTLVKHLHSAFSQYIANTFYILFTTLSKMAPSTRVRRTTSLPQVAETDNLTSQLVTQEDITNTIQDQLQNNTDLLSMRHDINILHTQLEDIRNALISLTRSHQQVNQQHNHSPHTTTNPPQLSPQPPTQQSFPQQSSTSQLPHRQTPPQLTYSSSSLPPTHDCLLQPSNQPLNIRELFARTSHATLTQSEFEAFARIPQERLTETDTRIFLNRLENYLTQDKTDDEFNAEARALRTLSQHIQWRTLAQWLQLYANIEVPFSYPREQFWRKKFDDNATRCYYQPPEKIDLATALQRLVDSQEARRNPPSTEHLSNSIDNNRRFNNSILF